MHSQSHIKTWDDLIPQGPCSFIFRPTPKDRFVLKNTETGYIQATQYLRHGLWCTSSFSWPESLAQGLLRVRLAYASHVPGRVICGHKNAMIHQVIDRTLGQLA